MGTSPSQGTSSRPGRGGGRVGDGLGSPVPGLTLADVPRRSRGAGQGGRAARCLRAMWRGAGLAALSLAGAGLLLVGVLGALGISVGIGVLLVPAVLAAARRVAALSRRLAKDWCGVEIPPPYRPPAGDAASPGALARVRDLVTDPATWRDLLWLAAGPVAGLLAAAPLLIAGWGLFTALSVFGVPQVWVPVAGLHSTGWYVLRASGPFTNPLPAVAGAGLISLGLWAAPALLGAHGRLARRMLAPTERARLAGQVRHLARTRQMAVDAGALELRRIERDLHDGAQARLVAMGMTLSAAQELIGTDPVAATALLREAQQSSVRALAELRDLVRGIHPPVLADRGLIEAVRALAVDSPVAVQVVADLPGRPPPAVESAAYFAVGELLTNVAKHAAAGTACVELWHERGLLHITVTDDGRGGADPASGTGLSGIERRLVAFDGTLAMTSPPGGPTLAALEVPCALS